MGDDETREAEIGTLSEKSDGIAKADRGFISIILDTEVGDRVTVEIDDVGSNVCLLESSTGTTGSEPPTSGHNQTGWNSCS